MLCELSEFKKKIFHMKRFFNEVDLFEDRAHAGSLLASCLSKLFSKLNYSLSNAIVLAIPAGGVPVGVMISEQLKIDFDIIVVRKLQIPYNPEAGFGALAPDGSIFLNEPLVRYLSLSDKVIREVKEKTLSIIKKREVKYRQNKAYPKINNRLVILTDDGLASGYTMLAAINWVKKRNPSKIVVAVPTAPVRTSVMISELIDALLVLNLREDFYFAVADAYIHWYDLSDGDVVFWLRKIGYYLT